jgi:hypothetical protein
VPESFLSEQAMVFLKMKLGINQEN